MGRQQQYEILLRRSSECEVLSQVAADISIRRKCAELAAEYRELANQAKELDYLEERQVRYKV